MHSIKNIRIKLEIIVTTFKGIKIRNTFSKNRYLEK
ncbi:replication protein [Clostridium sporogenes]|nr:replication protein [Clostridium sporogenes]NFS26424.1 replication protein [Clostridium sporogenes]